MADTVAGLAYEQSLRAIDHQQAALDGLRSRAGTVLAAAALATSFLGGSSLDDLDDSWSTAIAVVLFLGVLVAMLYVLLPRLWTFSISAKVMLENQRRAARPIIDHHTFLASKLEEHHDANQQRLNTLMRAFRLGCVALALEIPAWFMPW